MYFPISSTIVASFLCDNWTCHPTTPISAVQIAAGAALGTIPRHASISRGTADMSHEPLLIVFDSAECYCTQSIDFTSRQVSFRLSRTFSIHRESPCWSYASRIPTSNPRSGCLVPMVRMQAHPIRDGYWSWNIQSTLSRILKDTFQNTVLFCSWVDRHVWGHGREGYRYRYIRPVPLKSLNLPPLYAACPISTMPLDLASTMAGRLG